VIEVRRLSGIVLTAAFVTLCLLTCEWSLGATSRWWPRWLKNDWATVEFPAFRSCGPQIAGVVKEGYAGGRPIGLLIGASHQVFAIDQALLESEVQPRLKWLRLTVYVGTTCEIEQIARLLIKNQIRPAIVLLNFSFRMLARSERYRKFDATDIVAFDWRSMAEDLRAMRLRALKADAAILVGNAFNTVFADRVRINYRLNDRLVRMRMAFLEQCGQGIIAEYAPAWQPWRERDPDDIKAWLPEEVPAKLSQTMERFRKQGVFDPDLYHPSHEASASLVGVIRLLRSAGAEVVIVVMPERTATREATPPEARQTLSTLLRESFGAEAPRVIDLESIISDKHIIDMAHVDKWGQAVVTRRLIGELNRP